MAQDRTELYEQLAGEKDLVKKLKYFDKQVTALENTLKPFFESDIYSELDLEEKVKYDIFLSYSLTSLYWMYCRTVGEDPATHPVKEEVQRVQEYMKMYHTIKDRKKAPKLDTAAAKRFIRSGMFDHKQLQQGKRKVFEDEEDEDSSDSPAKKQSVTSNDD